jgi:hypothetical protein
MNVFREEPEVELPPWVAPEMPIYTLDEAGQIARKYLDEDPERAEGWEKVPIPSTHEGIESIWTKPIAANLTREFVYCTKVVGTINATINQIYDCYWNPKGELTWNTASVTSVKILEDKGAEQQVHVQLKKNPSVNIQNDLVIRRTVIDLSPKQRWIYCVSEKTNPESQPGWVRGLVLFGGVLIEAISSQQCRVSWVWSFDINKKLSVKYKDEEPKKVALRLFKMKQKIEGDIRLAARTKEYENQKNQGFDS